MVIRAYGIWLLTGLLAASAACGGIRRVQGYIDELAECTASSGETGGTGGTADSGEASGGPGSSGSGDETTGASDETTGAEPGTDGGEGASESGEATGSSSGGPMAACGNGVLEAFGAVPEECDDGNLDPDDGCGATCALDRRVFVSSTLHNGGDLGGLKLADAICANLADDQGWPDGLQYRAWLSDSSRDARDRLKRGRGRLVLVNGLVLAQSWEALLAGELENPLEVTEKSETYHGGVWTGTRPDGTAVPEGQHCEAWKTQSIFPTGHFGYSDRLMGEWTLAIDADQPATCPVDFAIYCFQSL